MLLGVGSDLFLMVPEQSVKRRHLHPGRVVDRRDGSFVAEFGEPVPLAVAGAAVAFGEDGGRFHQQGTVVTDLRPDAARPTYCFDRVGDPVSAEQRQAYRVTVALAGLTAEVGRDAACPVLDVSAEGMGVIAPRPLNLGSMTELHFAHDGDAVTTLARVQTVRERPDGTFRLGLLAPDRKGGARRSLQRLTSAFQRQQLRRMAGAA